MSYGKGEVLTEKGGFGVKRQYLENWYSFHNFIINFYVELKTHLLLIMPITLIDYGCVLGNDKFVIKSNYIFWSRLNCVKKKGKCTLLTKYVIYGNTDFLLD